MELRVLFASFALVFLAELGDKTQLTALAFTTSSKSPWMVFLGTSLALVAASAIAVLFGEALNRIAVVQKYLPIISGAMFILMGLVLLINVARKVEPPLEIVPGERETVGSMPAKGGALFSLIVGHAATLEQGLLRNLESIWHDLPDGHEKDILGKIIKEDKRHLEALEGMPDRHGARFDSQKTEITSAEFEQLRTGTALFDETKVECPAITGERKEELIRKAIEFEESIAQSYLAFAQMAKVHAVRDAFRWLAMEDIRHAQTLCDLVNPSELEDGRRRA